MFEQASASTKRHFSMTMCQSWVFTAILSTFMLDKLLQDTSQGETTAAMETKS